jgi:hypothetical protein
MSYVQLKKVSNWGITYRLGKRVVVLCDGQRLNVQWPDKSQATTIASLVARATREHTYEQNQRNPTVTTMTRFGFWHSLYGVRVWVPIHRVRVAENQLKFEKRRGG